MNRKTILGLAAGLLFANGMFAIDPQLENLDLNTIEYIEEEDSFELGFDTADYLPEDFNASEVYFNINAVQYIEEEYALNIETKSFLPEGFDAYAFPTDVQSINYIDERDAFEFKGISLMKNYQRIHSRLSK